MRACHGACFVLPGAATASSCCRCQRNEKQYLSTPSVCKQYAFRTSHPKVVEAVSHCFQRREFIDSAAMYSVRTHHPCPQVQTTTTCSMLHHHAPGSTHPSTFIGSSDQEPGASDHPPVPPLCILRSYGVGDVMQLFSSIQAVTHFIDLRVQSCRLRPTYCTT